MRRRTRKLASLIGAAALVAGGLLVLTPTSGGALTQIVVSSAADTGVGSLRVAFTAANSGGSAGGDDVEIVVPASVGNISLTTGQLAYDGGDGGTHSLTLRGSGTTISQDFANARVVEITSNSATTFTVDGLVLTGGEGVALGGAINAQAGANVVVTNSTLTGNTVTDSGGAIHMGGNLTITNSTISGNTAPSSAGAFAAGTMTISGSTLTGNNESGTGGALGTNGLATITNSTITGNTAAQGGALYAQGPLSLAYVTVVENTAGTGANLSFQASAFTSFGSVIALPLGGGTNCDGQSGTTSQGYNWDDDGTCGFGSGPGDMSDAGNPQLGALNNNGGPTPTMAPAAGSGLVDKIPASSPCAGVNITVDQRGLPRPVTAGQFCDIGAYEIQVAALQSDRLTFAG